MQLGIRLVFFGIAIFLAQLLSAQRLFPVKVNSQWGLMNTNGAIAIPPIYDAIGGFKRFGYATMQREGKVGLLNDNGKEIIRPLYEDIKVLDSTLIAVMDAQQWKVINLEGKLVLPKGYQRIQVVAPGYLSYRMSNRWGVVNAQGATIIPPAYEEIKVIDTFYFQTQFDGKYGLTSFQGEAIIHDVAEEIKVFNSNLFFYKKDRLWGAVNKNGEEKIATNYTSYRAMDANYIKLMEHDKTAVFSLKCESLISGHDLDDFYPFSEKYIISKKNRRLGLIDQCGETLLPPLYNEIQSYNGEYFRVNFEGHWGVVDKQNEVIVPLAYHYISPSQGAVSLVKQGNKFGMVNISGDTIVPVEFAKIDWTAQQAKAYREITDNPQESLTIYNFDSAGNLTHNDEFNQHFQVKIGGSPSTTENNDFSEEPTAYLLKQFEWFYAPTADRWGLRKLSDGSIQIEPQFDYIQVEKELGITLVGIWKANDYEYERTSFRYEMIFGLVINNLGILVTELNFIDVKLDDFRQKLPLARVTFSNGRYGLMDCLGRIIRDDAAYIGEFRNGFARISLSGRISAKRNAENNLGDLTSYLNKLLTPSYMVDYTQYDQVFEVEAKVICENCSWGYIDTLGQVLVKPVYDFAQSMVNQAGIVQQQNKWGMVNTNGSLIIPCQYDGIEFLESTNNKMIRVYIEQPKYGLIDTLGQLTVSAIYEEIGSFADGRLAVKRNGKWGYVNQSGTEIIPCRFEEALNFNEGFAAVKIGGKWGFIDTEGNMRISATYGRIGNFSHGLAWVYIGQNYGFIDSTNQFVIPPAFDRAFDFQQGVARVTVDGEYGLINTQGAFVVKPRFGAIEPFDQYGLAVARIGKDRIRYGVINLNGQIITNEDFKSIEPFYEGFAVVKSKNGYGYIDTNGKIVIPCQYSRAARFQEGRASVQLAGKCGYIDQTGELVVPCAYSRCLDYSGGRAVVYRGIKKAGILNLEGEELVVPSLDRLIEFQEGRGLMRDDNYRFYYITEQTNHYNGYYDNASGFQHGIAVVEINNKWGVINQKGIEIIPPKYDAIENFENGFAKVKIQGYNGLSNLAGDLIIKPDYEFITYAGDGLFRVEQGDKIGYFDSQGKWVWDLSR